MTWISLICLLVFSSSALGRSAYGNFPSRLLHKPIVPVPFTMPTTSNIMSDKIMSMTPVSSPQVNNYDSLVMSSSRVPVFDKPIAPLLPLSEADILCKDKRPETIIPIGQGQKFIVCLDESKGVEQFCPKGLLYNSEFRRCERKYGLPDPCLSQPCLNGGQCIRTESSYKCECMKGYDGRICELDSRVCETQQPCGSSTENRCQSFHVGAALQHVCILEEGLSYGLTWQQTHPSPCRGVDGPHSLAFSNKGFIMCDGENMFVLSCPGGTIWDNLNKACVWPEMEGVVKIKLSDESILKNVEKVNYETSRPVEYRPLSRPVEQYQGYGSPMPVNPTVWPMKQDFSSMIKSTGY